MAVESARNLLFGVLCLQAGLIQPEQFIQACTLWANRKDAPLAELLINRTWVAARDCAALEQVLDRKLKKAQREGRASCKPDVLDSNSSGFALSVPESSAGVFQLRELLGSFVSVCNAVAFAHSRGIFHREQATCRKLWADVERLLEQSRAGSSIF